MAAHANLVNSGLGKKLERAEQITSIDALFFTHLSLQAAAPWPAFPNHLQR